MHFLAVSLADDNTAFYREALEKSMSPLALLLTAALALLIFARSRSIAVTALIAAICYLPQTETLNLGLHFYSIRIVLLAGIIRVFSRGEHKGFRLSKVDKALLAYALLIPVVAVLRAPEELTFRLGGLYDILLSYFLFRFLVRNETDFKLLLSKAAYIIVPFAALVLYESISNHNFFSVFNGIPESSWIRNGSTRAQGPFRNPITAGSFGATFGMLYASLFFSGVRKRFVIVGFFASTAIVLSSHSSGPFLGLALGLLAFVCWRWRRHLKKILYGSLGLLIALQLLMNSPVWFLIGRISEVTGGGGYHRAMLIEQTVRHFDRWWLAGTVETTDWFPYEVNGKADITNFFVAAAVDAGLIGLFAAVFLVVACFKMLGLTITARPDLSTKKLLWGVGSTLVGSIGILFSVTYMDQMQIAWYLLLASVTALTIASRPVVLPPPTAPPRYRRTREPVAVAWRESWRN